MAAEEKLMLRAIELPREQSREHRILLYRGGLVEDMGAAECHAYGAPTSGGFDPALPGWACPRLKSVPFKK